MLLLYASFCDDYDPQASAQVLAVVGLTYLVAGAPCAGVAKLALVFLATGSLDAIHGCHVDAVTGDAITGCHHFCGHPVSSGATLISQQ